MSKIAVVTTTITLPENFPEIYKNAQEHDQHDIHYYVVGDNKTPKAQLTKYLSQTIPKEDFTNFTISQQKQWLKSNFGKDKSEEYEKVFQENNYQRRIIGFLKAKQEGAEKIIVVDDDNFPHPDDDFIGAHTNVVGVKDEHACLTSDVGYIDLLSVLKYNGKGDNRCYVRGYPMYLRGQQRIGFGIVKTNPAVNIGLWSESPDISALSRVAYGDPVVERNPKMYPLVVPEEHYTSMCMQNLCFDTEYLITQYEFPMNVPMGGLTLGRYDDIWAGYVTKKILDKMDRGMTFGTPQAIHRRYVHDFDKDFKQEFWGLYLNDYVYNAIKTMPLDSKDAWSAFTEIIVRMRSGLRFIDYEIRDYFNRVYEDMHNWAEMNRTLFPQ